MTVSATCQWTATSGATWITITSGAAGTGNGTVSFTVANNTGAARTGTLTIAGRAFTVTQAASSSPTPPPPPPAVLQLFHLSAQRQRTGAGGHGKCGRVHDERVRVDGVE